MSEKSNIVPIEKFSSGFIGLNMEVKGSRELELKIYEAANIILRVSFPLFRAKIRLMGTLDTSLTVRVKDCFCPLQMDMFEFTRANWLGVLSEIEDLIAIPEVSVREVSAKKHLHFRFSVKAKAKQLLCGMKRYHWTGEEKHYED